MNYYFLLEDEKSFIKVLPSWLEYMGFKAQRVADIKDVKENNYVMQSGQGVTQLITRALYQTLDTLRNYPKTIDYLIIILDAEEIKCMQRKQMVEKKLCEYKTDKKMEFDFNYKIFVCNHCFESWLLGNRDLYPAESPSVNSDFYNFYKYYNISTKDMEKMCVPPNLDDTTAMYHFHYLHEACRYSNIRYSKKNPRNMAKKEYFDKLISRTITTSHLQSFREFCEFFMTGG